ncbi:MAG: helix-turn-helix domain-containing protein [Actinobacteria bacterium]|uniref:Unannotated protein n=1 Tax=freshwater metagenome TaxID=449393 RepID=A0A6J7KRJ8_9ZZZZ|nr:helix-turn-helix domain-containing protein [Actinomycetota bacterium]
MTRAEGGDSVLSRVVRILEAFTADDAALRVTDVAQRTGLHVATASRLIADMVDEGLLVRRPDRRIGIGLRLWELASRASPAVTLREAAMPFLEDLHAVIGHHVQLGVLEGTEVLFIERLSAPNSVINYSRVAGRLPLHSSSSGLVLLAHASPTVQQQVLEGALEVFTPHTLHTPRQLRAMLAEVRTQGYAYLPGHVHEDALGIAVPIAGARGSVVAAVSAIVPNDPQARAVIPMLRAAARGIARSYADSR